MIFLVLLAVTLVAMVAVTVWSAVADTRSAPADEPTEAAPPVAAPFEPETLEGVLARQLLDGEITGAQYRHAVHRLAARDADRHPLSLPYPE
jgi:hypothetical protein